MTQDNNAIVDVHERLARLLDWNLLRTYIAIVHYGGISRAAEQVHLSQPAVSQSLKRLEAHLGLKLIERNARKFEVTEAGELVYAKSLEIHNQISRLGDVASREQGNVSGSIRILFASRLKSEVLDNLVKNFMSIHPDVTLRIDVLPSIEIQALIQQGLGCAGFCLLRGTPEDLETELCLSQRFGLYCGQGHSYFGRSDLKAAALKDQDFITFPSDQMGGVLSPLAVYREQHVFEGRVVATSASLDEIIRLTKLGIGVGLLPKHIARDYVEAGTLWRLPPHKGIGPIDIHLVWNPSTDLSDAERAFVSYAHNHISQTPIKERIPK